MKLRLETFSLYCIKVYSSKKCCAFIVLISSEPDARQCGLLFRSQRVLYKTEEILILKYFINLALCSRIVLCRGNV